MGFNTVVLLHNDQTDKWPEEIKRAMNELDYYRQFVYSYRQKGLLAGFFGYGNIASVHHADDPRVTVSSQNYAVSFRWDGTRLDDREDLKLPWMALETMQHILERNGYKVTKLKRPRKEVHVPCANQEKNE